MVAARVGCHCLQYRNSKQPSKFLHSKARSHFEPVQRTGVVDDAIRQTERRGLSWNQVEPVAPLRLNKFIS